MDSTYNPWTTSGVHKRNQRNVRDKAVHSLHISTYWLGEDKTVIITKPDRDTVRSRLQNFISCFPGGRHFLYFGHLKKPQTTTDTKTTGIQRRINR